MITTTYPSGLVTFRHLAGHVLTLPGDTDPDELADKIGSFIRTIEGVGDTDAGVHSLHRQIARTNLIEARRQRDELRDELCALERLLAEAKEEVVYWRGKADRLCETLAATREEQRIDGDLLLDTIIEACPEWLTDDACRHVAERTITELARVEGVPVLRGTHSEPWTPDPETSVNAPGSGNDPGCNTVVCDKTGVADASIIGDEWFEWAVFRADPASLHPFHVVDAHDQADAERLTEEIEGTWVARRRVITEDWEPVD